MLTFALVPLLAVLAQGPVPVADAHPSLTRAIKAATSVYMVAVLIDTAQTEYALGTGRFTESNPMVSWADDPISMALLKGSSALAMSYCITRLQKEHPRLALVTVAAMTVMTGYAIHRNAQTIRSHPR